MKKLLGTDGVRAIACLMVLAHHLAQRLNTSELGPWGLLCHKLAIKGDMGVSVFFVLSGFLLSYPFWEAYLQHASIPNLRVYGIRRASRIIPGFYLNLFFCYLISLLILPEYHKSGVLLSPALFWRYLSGLSFTSGFHWLTFFPSSINGPLWSISFEVISYFLMPLGMIGLFIVFRQKPTLIKGLLWWIFILVLVCVINQLIIDNVKINDLGKGWEFGNVGGAKVYMPGYNPIGFFAHFSMGILASSLVVWLYQTKWTETLRNRGIGDITALFFIGLLVLQYANLIAMPSFLTNFQKQPYSFPLFALLIGLLLASLSQSKYLGQVVDNSILSYISKISFGLYIWHFVVIGFVNTVFTRYLSDSGMSTLKWWTLGSVLAVIISFILAAASWHLIEKPMLQKGHAWKPQSSITSLIFNWKTLTVGAILILIPLLLALNKPYALSFPPPWF